MVFSRWKRVPKDRISDTNQQGSRGDRSSCWSHFRQDKDTQKPNREKDGYRGPMRCQCWSPNDFVPLPELNCILIIYINTDRIWFMIIFLIHIPFCNTLLPYIVLRSEWCLDTSSCFKYILRFSPAALAPKPGRHRGWWVWWSKMYMFHRLLSLVTMMYNEHDQLTMCHPDWRWLYDCNM